MLKKIWLGSFIGLFTGALFGGPIEIDKSSHLFHSQASQDQFVYLLLCELEKQEEPGYYLEIGAWKPIHANNSYFFEHTLGWQGVSLEINPVFADLWAKKRTNLLLIEDAEVADYDKILESFPSMIDYLSLDVDENYTKVLEKLPLDTYTFKVITIEHDYYRYGDKYKKEEEKILKAKGYYRLCSNVMTQVGHAFEDWWIHPDAFSPELFSELISLDLDNMSHIKIIEILRTYPNK